MQGVGLDEGDRETRRVARNRRMAAAFLGAVAVAVGAAFGCSDGSPSVRASSSNDASGAVVGDVTTIDAPSNAPDAPRDDERPEASTDAPADAGPMGAEADVGIDSPFDAEGGSDASPDRDEVDEMDAETCCDFDAPEADVPDSRDGGPDSGDGGPDSRDGGPDSGDGPTGTIIRHLLGGACLDCVLGAGCLGPGKRCEDLGNALSIAGPSMGQPRQSLCMDTLTCIFTTLCDEEGSGVDACLCGLVPRVDCESQGPTPLPGYECISEEEAGLETTDPTAEFTVETSPSLGAGIANAIVLCAFAANCTQCIQ